MKINELWICFKFFMGDYCPDYQIGEKVEILEVPNDEVLIVRIENKNSVDLFSRQIFIQHFRKCWEQ